MTRRRSVLFLSTAAVLIAIAILPAWSDPPSLEWMEPGQGFVDEDTEVTLEGQGMMPAASVATVTGGPFLAASHDAADVARDLTVAGNYVYVADSDAGLQIIDVSDPLAPTLAGSYDTPGRSHDVAVAGGYAYVADRRGGLQIIDVSDPYAPVFAGSYEPMRQADGVALAGSYAYVTDFYDGLHVIDVSDPHEPFLIASYETPGSPDGIALAGDYAYVADGRNSGLLVFDISDPHALDIVGSHDLPGYAEGVALAGGYAYVAAGSGGLLAIDVSDPHAPGVVGSYPVAEWTDDVAASGHYVYVVDGSSFSSEARLLILDVTDPSAPTLAGHVDTPGAAQGVALATDYAYVADNSSGVHVIAVSNPRGPAPAATLATPGRVRDVEVVGRYAYMVESDDGVPEGNGLRIVDIDDPESPAVIGNVDWERLALRVAVSPPYAYVAHFYDGLQVIDVSDPLQPALVGEYDPDDVWGSLGVSTLTYGVASNGDFAYLATRYVGEYGSSGGLEVVDVSDPQSPALKGWYETPIRAYDVAVRGSHAYLLAGELSVIDVSDSQNPVPVGSLDVWGVDIELSGDYAYVANEYWGLQVIDVSDPHAPALVGSYDTPGRAQGVALIGDRAYVSDGRGGVHVLDVSVPSAPVLVETYQTAGFASAVDASGLHLLVADGEGGLQVIRRNPPLRDVTTQPGTTMHLTVPAGFNPGPYHLLVTNPDGESSILHNGYHACLRRELIGTLAPVADAAAGRAWPPMSRRPERWRVRVEGDPAFFDPEPRHRASLLLPDLPSNLTTHFVQDGQHDGITINLRLTPGGGFGTVHAVGTDADAVRELWERIESEGRVALPRIDGHTYGDVILRLAPGASKPGQGRTASAEHPRYRYKFVDGALVEARAWGPEANLVIDLSATDEYVCRYEDEIRFAETSHEGGRH